MKYRNSFLFIYSVVVQLFYTQTTYAHEPWLLTSKQIELLNSQPRPEIYSTFTTFNVSVVLLVLSFFLTWIFVNYLLPEKKRINYKTNIALLLIRCGLGSTLILLSLGLIPRIGIAYFSEPTLLAPEFLVNSISHGFRWISNLELILGICFLFGILVRLSCILVIFLLLLAFYIFGYNTFQYIGFYLGNLIFLILLGSGQYALFPHRQTSALKSPKIALFALQVLTGLNFIYSSISIKFLQPNLDIGMLQMHKAFTFGLSHVHFAFLMMITELTLGLCLILGFRLQYIATILILLFLFLSINLSENLLAHNFIYGILLTFILLGGIPFSLGNFKHYFYGTENSS